MNISTLSFSRRDQIFIFEFTSRGFEKFEQKIRLPPVEVEPITLAIAGLEVLIWLMFPLDSNENQFLIFYLYCNVRYLKKIVELVTDFTK